MTIRCFLPLLPLLLACLPACGDDPSGISGASRASASAGSTNLGSSAGGKSAQGGAPGSAAAGGATGSAISAGSGAGGSAGSASANQNPPTPWNSAKAASVSDAQLQVEYDSWKAAHVETCTNGSAVVLKDADSVVSEGIGYGMLIAVAMADQALFDGLWKYYQDHLDKNGLMNWQTQRCEAPGNNNRGAATDADLDTTMALVQASARWAAGDYGLKAQALAAKVSGLESDMCDGRRVLRPGDTWGGCSDPSDKRINPSYFAPGYYKVFAQRFPEQAATWTALGDGSYQLFAIYQARMNNLVPDWSGPDGSDNGSSYWYDACRTPWRVAVDYAWTGDTRAKSFMQNVSSWVDQQGGLPSAAQQQNSAFLGAFALAGAYEQGKFDTYMSSWLSTETDDTPYYQATLRVLYLLVAAGKFSSTL